MIKFSKYPCHKKLGILLGFHKYNFFSRNITNLKYLILNVKQVGIVDTLKRIVFRFGKINTFNIYSFDCNTEVPEIKTPPEIKVREISIKELKQIRTNFHALPAEFYRDKIEVDSRCFGAFVNEKLAYIVWLSRSGTKGFLELSSNDGEIKYAYCLSEFRGRHLYVITVTSLLKVAKNLGYKKIWGVIHDGNIAAIKSINKCGFKKVGQVKRIGSFTWEKAIN